MFRFIWKWHNKRKVRTNLKGSGKLPFSEFLGLQSHGLEFSKCQILGQTCATIWWKKKLESRSRIPKKDSKRVSMPASWWEFFGFRIGLPERDHHWRNPRKNITESAAIWASRGIANPEIISSFGPRTFWRRDEVPNRNFSIWAEVTYQQGNHKMGNVHWKDTSSPSHCALVLLLIEITNMISICATGLSEGKICLKSSIIFHVSNFYSNYRKYAMPFQQKHSFIDLVISWAIVVDIDRLCHRQLSHKRAHLFLLKSNDCCFHHVSSCAWLRSLRILSGKQIKFSIFVQHDCALQYFWALLNLRETCGRHPLLFADGTATLKTSKSASMDSPSFFMYKTKKVSWAFLWMKDFALGLGLWRLGRRSWAQHLAADDGRNGNCGFPTLRNVNREI